MKIGVIGVGYMGENHARIYKEKKALHGIYDINKKRLNDVSNKYNCILYNDYHDLIHDVDAISIASPNDTHYEIAKYALENGVHTLIEKPISDNIGNAEELISISKENNCILLVGHIERYNPVISKIKKEIENNTFGHIYSFSSKRLGMYTPKYKDNVLFDLSVHDIDVMRYLSESEVHSVFAVCENNIHDNIDNSAIILNFNNGIFGIIEVSWLATYGIRRMEITCQNNMVEIDYSDQSYKKSNRYMNEKDNIVSKTTKTSMRKIEPLKLEIEDFIDSILHKKEPLVGGDDGLMNLKIATAAIESNNLGKKVYIK